MTDQVDIKPQEVSDGAAQWRAASESLKWAWDMVQGAIDAAGDCWGSDGPGSAFSKSYKPELLLDSGETILKQVSELGPRVEKAVGFSMAADEEQAAQMLDVTKKV